ncbi:MAG: ATP-dependent DNA helicase [Rhodospirillaceae bacterium]|nr:ATP-dependent DNA helicase [Rhodospirillaceae bacterium]
MAPLSKGAPTGDARPLPILPVLVAGLRRACWFAPGKNGEAGIVESLTLKEAAARVRRGPAPVVCHMPATAKRLGLAGFASLDVLELFAFTRPAKFCLPTPRGLAQALGLALPKTLEDEARCLSTAVSALLDEIAAPDLMRNREVTALARVMADAGWRWGEQTLAVLPKGKATDEATQRRALEVWHGLKEWSEYAPEPPTGQAVVEPEESLKRLADLLGPNAESRPQQKEYTAGVTAAFSPRQNEDEPQLVLAEAGTGTGKTLGYLAPASLWAQKNNGPVWISTYTKNLQHQIDHELDSLYPDSGRKAAKVVIRKGRENYLCLLNLEEAVAALPTRTDASRERDGAALGLIARWAIASRDGDMMGGDFPAWLGDLLEKPRTYALADRRGECIYSACSHFKKCFIERSIRRAWRAEIVVANHALVMIQAALGGGTDDDVFSPARYVFDEGHHIFDAADSAFSAHLSGVEMLELRRWIIGPEKSRRGSVTGAGAGGGRMRGLEKRVGDLAARDEKASLALNETQNAALALPAPGWMSRINNGTPQGPGEAFLALLRQQVYARAAQPGSQYSLETEARPAANSPGDGLVEGLIETALALEASLALLATPLTALATHLSRLIDEQASEMDSHDRQRIEAMCRGLARRAETQVEAWGSMLASLTEEQPAAFVDWFAVDRSGGRDVDVGFNRHWIDPTLPFIDYVARPAQGLLITSATLCDHDNKANESDDEPAPDWIAADQRTGACHLKGEPGRIALPSPFDYPNQTRVLVVTDVTRDNPDQVASAYRELFLAAGGGGLGLFTAISRLRAVHQRLAAPLDEAGLPLLAQHVDGLDTATLIDIFRAEHDACLLGTDAIRDGVDVPGTALRLIVFDRVPWPRPDILHSARRKAYGARVYDDRLTRLRLKQAYGRLVRKADDHGVFILLDNRMPSRLGTAFPPGVEMQRLGLAEAVSLTRDFLQP